MGTDGLVDAHGLRAPLTELKRAAELSEDGLYRYALWRRWGDGLPLGFVMLNPSTADAERDDPTVGRCMGFARREGFGALVVLNLYALRATKPDHLLDHPDPEGPENFARAWELLPSRVVVAWGSAGRRLHDAGLPGSSVLALVRERALVGGHSGTYQCLGLNHDGQPKHPLYVPADRELQDWSP